ncbi:PKD [Methanospirillum hungatei JF-1]|uniref:PKD n=1 Tax=Methanospirillum hungatei JF-1 (strain ATCC 27890 / DSM 864 / NBRC 100397 / JF-1) TaxID=323259 RepID=Q2FN85_METHJ|nr:PKD domain-containing protein [Methanospirillum hungatei]ABD42118.1 PKD [Methanospirillum hungatei JF-1]
MTPHDLNNKAVSTLVGLILIIFLVVAMAGIIYALIFGLVSSVEKTAYVVTGAKIIPIAPNIDGIEVVHRNGDTMYYENQSRDAQYEVRFMVDTSEESSVVITDPTYLSSDTTWSPGDRVIIFRKADGYYLANDPALISGAIPLPSGPIAIRIIDNTHSQLIAYEGAGSIGSEPTSTPTTEPTTEPTTIPPTPTPVPVQNCYNCGPGEGFTVSFTTQVRGLLTIRFKDDSSPQPNTRAWTFGDGGSASGELIDHTFPAPGSYQITLTVKRNNSPCTCTLTRWIMVG